MRPNDLFTRSGYNWNQFSTRVDEYRDVTIKPKVFKGDSSRINNTKKRKYYNY